MLNKKLIIGANEMTEVIYIGTNVHATGGMKKKGERKLTNRNVGFTSMGLGEGDKNFIPKEEIVVAKYHVKNYEQRNKKRRIAIKELIYNNFEPRKCMMITLNFKDIKKEKDTTESSCWDIKEGHLFYESSKLVEEFDISKMSNQLFSPAIKVAEIKETNESDERYHNLKICNAEFKKFIQKMNYRYDNFKYVAVMGRQDNGNWHYHMICNLAYIDFDKLMKIWGKGGCYISKITYMTTLNKKVEYLNKNMSMASTGLKGETGYLKSAGLNRNIVIRSWRDEEQLAFENENSRLDTERSKGMKCISKRITSYTYHGKIASSCDGIFIEEGKEYECDCTIKYFKYPLCSEKFKLLDTAKPKGKQVK